MVAIQDWGFISFDHNGVWVLSVDIVFSESIFCSFPIWRYVAWFSTIWYVWLIQSTLLAISEILASSKSPASGNPQEPPPPERAPSTVLAFCCWAIVEAKVWVPASAATLLYAFAAVPLTVTTR